jgi:hypothetical protein
MQNKLAWAIQMPPVGGFGKSRRLLQEIDSILRVSTFWIPTKLHPVLYTKNMCEFCNNPFAANNRDAQNIAFAGFFSSEAIEAAVRQARQNATSTSSGNDEDEDSDGT